MKAKIKKTGIKILNLLIVITLSFQSIAFNNLVNAADTPDNSSNSTQTQAASTKSFSVTKYLSIDKQDQSYLVKDPKTKEPVKGVPIAIFIVQIINFITLTVGSLSLLAIIAGGFILMTSHGSENQTTKGKEIIKLAIIGLVITFCAYFIVSFVQSLLYEL